MISQLTQYGKKINIKIKYSNKIPIFCEIHIRFYNFKVFNPPNIVENLSAEVLMLIQSVLNSDTIFHLLIITWSTGLKKHVQVDAIFTQEHYVGLERAQRNYHLLKRSCIGLTGVDAFVRIKARFLCEPFETQVALKGSFARMRSHMNFQVRLAAESCIANLFSMQKIQRMSVLIIFQD